MKTTALTPIHHELGAKMTDFAGYEMPVYYDGIKSEHKAVREAVGLFDVSHMGEFIVEGNQALTYLEYATSNEVAKLKDGKVQYSCLPNEKGGIVDDLLVYCLEEGSKYLLVVNASNIEKDWQHLQNLIGPFDVKLRDESDETALIALQGPKATQVLQKLTKTDLDSLAYYTFTHGEVAGVADVLISATGYTGSGGFELYIPNKDAATVWKALMESGEAFGIQPAGLGARDTLRLEKGFCLYGNDINDDTSPIEAGLGWITKFNKNFCGKDLILVHKENGPPRRLKALTFEEKVIPRHGMDLTNEAGEVVGTVTSGTISPSLGYPIALAMLNRAHIEAKAPTFLKVRKKTAQGKRVKLPFLP